MFIVNKMTCCRGYSLFHRYTANWNDIYYSYTVKIHNVKDIHVGIRIFSYSALCKYFY